MQSESCMVREGIHPSGYCYSSAQIYCCCYVILSLYLVKQGTYFTFLDRPSLFLTDVDDDDDSVLIGQHNYILHYINECSLLGGVEKSHNPIYPFQY